MSELAPGRGKRPSGDIPTPWPSRDFLPPSHLRDLVPRLVVSGYLRHLQLAVERAKEQTLDDWQSDVRAIREIHLNRRGVAVHTSIDRVQRRMRQLPAGAVEGYVRRRSRGRAVAASGSRLTSVRCRIVSEVDEPAHATL